MLLKFITIKLVKFEVTPKIRPGTSSLQAVWWDGEQKQSMKSSIFYLHIGPPLLLASVPKRHRGGSKQANANLYAVIQSYFPYQYYHRLFLFISTCMIVIWLDKSHSSKLFISLKQLISQFFFSVLFMCAMYREIRNNCSYYEGNSKEIFFNIGLCSQCCVYG